MTRAGNRYVTVADQAVSSVSNFLLVAVVAHTSSVAAFGAFSLAYVVVVFFLGLERALVGEVLLVRSSAEEGAPSEFGAVLGVGLLLGLLGALGFVGASFFFPDHGAIWVVLGLALPLVLVQDVIRYVLICCQRSAWALLLDIVWAVVSAGAMIGLAALGRSNTWVVAGWLVGAAVSLAIGLGVVRTAPHPRAGIAWFRANRPLSLRYGAEFASLNASTALVWFVLTIPLGTVGVAALRGAALLFSPLNAAFNAIRIAVIPDLVRSRGTTRYRRSLLEAVGALAVLALLWGGGALLLPAGLGRTVLGSTWEAAADLRPAAFVQALAMVGYTVVLAHFRATQANTSSSRMRGLLALLTVVVPTSLALAAGVAGAAWGFAGAVACAGTVGGLLCVRGRAPFAQEEPA